MSTKGTLTLTVSEFKVWNAGENQCSSATANLDNHNDNKIQLVDGNTTDFEIVIYSHGSNTSLEFLVVLGDSVVGYDEVYPVGIAFKESDGQSADPIGLNEFPESTVSGDSATRMLTVKLNNQNEDVTWDFLVVIQAVSRGEDGSVTSSAIGIVDPRVRGSTSTPP